VKAFLRRNRDILPMEGLVYDMYEAMEIVGPSDSEGYFHQSGYF
jgi:hypothetical protein